MEPKGDKKSKVVNNTEYSRNWMDYYVNSKEFVTRPPSIEERKIAQIEETKKYIDKFKNYEDIGTMAALSKYIDKFNPFSNSSSDSVNRKITNKIVGENYKNIYKELSKGVNNVAQSTITTLLELPLYSDKGIKCESDQCAKFVRDDIYKSISTKMGVDKFFSTLGVYGDAWNMADNVIRKGGNSVYNRMTDKGKIKGVKPGDIVSIFTGGTSPYQAEADIKGDGNSHVGYVRKVYADGSFDVNDNTHQKKEDGKWQGVAYTIRFNSDGKVQNAYNKRIFHKINRITRPNYDKIPTNYQEVEKFEADPSITRYIGKKGYERVVNMTEFINANSKKIQNFYKLNAEELSSLSKAAIGIMSKESKVGSSFSMGDKLPDTVSDVVRNTYEIGASLS